MEAGHERHHMGREDGTLTWWSSATDYEGDKWPDELEPDAVIPVRWTGGDIPSEGMVLVDALRLRALDVIARQNAVRLHEAEQEEASIRKRWSELGDIYNAERERRQLAEKVIADLRRTIDRLRAAAAMAPEGLDNVHVSVSPEAVDEALDDVDETLARCYPKGSYP